MLREVAPRAAEAGVILGLENSLSPADNVKLVDLVGHPAVRVYYDVHNMATYRHGDQAVPGIKLLGKERICAVHVKNGMLRIEEPGPIDWPAAFRAFNEIGYDGWYVFETAIAPPWPAPRTRRPTSPSSANTCGCRPRNRDLVTRCPRWLGAGTGSEHSRRSAEAQRVSRSPGNRKKARSVT